MLRPAATGGAAPGSPGYFGKEEDRSVAGRVDPYSAWQMQGRALIRGRHRALRPDKLFATCAMAGQVMPSTARRAFRKPGAPKSRL